MNDAVFNNRKKFINTVATFFGAHASYLKKIVSYTRSLKICWHSIIPEILLTNKTLSADKLCDCQLQMESNTPVDILHLLRASLLLNYWL
jgi:hypothetical protein